MSEKPHSGRRGAVKRRRRTLARMQAPASPFFRTAEVIEKADISHQVLYRYITLGLIEPAVTTDTGVRLFHPVVVSLIDIIKGLNASGYSLRDMKEIFFKDERVQRLLRTATPANREGQTTILPLRSREGS